VSLKIPSVELPAEQEITVAATMPSAKNFAVVIVRVF
jgi:hypothetical protein